MNRLVFVALALVVATGGRAHAVPPSNPAFLGILMASAPTTDPGCIVEDVTAGGAAEAAHVMRADLIVELDGVHVTDCIALTDQIIAHQPGDEVRIDVLRVDPRSYTQTFDRVALHARLMSRAEVLQRRYVGAPLPGLEVTDYDDGHVLDLSELRGETRVLAWFDPTCDGCTQLIERVARKAKVLAVTHGKRDQLEVSRFSTKLGVPVAVMSTAEFDSMAMNERDRAYFTVVDGRGIVRFVLPIVPDADDADGAIDDVLAAVEQTDHAHRR